MLALCAIDFPLENTKNHLREMMWPFFAPIFTILTWPSSVSVTHAAAQLRRQTWLFLPLKTYSHKNSRRWPDTAHLFLYYHSVMN
jgi:hypothetical protein